jgi:cell division protein FtsB
MKGRYVLGAILLAGATYFAFFGGEYSLLEIARIRHEKGIEQERYDSVREDVVLLQARVDSLENDGPTIMRIARERWGLIRQGEHLYRFDGADSTSADSARTWPMFYRGRASGPQPQFRLGFGRDDR